MSEQLNLSGISAHSTPHIGVNGVWGTAGALAIKESLSLGSLEGVMDVLDTMTPKGMASVLRESGFTVSPGVVDKGRMALLDAVQHDLIKAIHLRTDGFGLAAERNNSELNTNHVVANKERFFMNNSTSSGVRSESLSNEFFGDYESMMAIQNVMRSDSIVVDLLGDALPGDRNSLMFIASQATQKGLQGFGFDGIPGKYMVPLSMAEVSDLHKSAARAVAEESARNALGIWVDGGKVNEVSEWVPDSVQRLLYGSLSMVTASAVVNAIESGMVGRHAEEIGNHSFARLLAEQGFNVKSATIDVQAKELGIMLVEPNTDRGQYVGPVVGLDHRSALIKFARDQAVGLPFNYLNEDQARPNVGDTVRMKFKAGDLTVSMAERPARDGVGR